MSLAPPARSVEAPPPGLAGRVRSRLAGRSAAALWIAGGIACAGACRAPEAYASDADRAVEEVLAPSSASVLAHRAETVVYPEKKATPPAPQPPPIEEQPVAPGAPAAQQAPAVEEHPARVISLREALEIAIESSRDYVSRKESLYLSALGLTGTRHSYGPLLSSVLSYLFSDSDSSSASQSASLTGGVTQILPWGGSVGVDASSALSRTGSSGSFSSAMSIQLTQPLLRGAGHLVAHEALTQGERNLVYAIREFELFREGFSIDVASRYYNLVQQKQSVENQQRNMDSVVFGRRQAEALFSVGRSNELDVLRARRQELTSRNTLIEAEESYRLALDRFRIFLGLPDSERVEVRPEEPPFVEVDYDVRSAIEVALKNRLDYLNRKEQLEDSARSVRIAENQLLPSLDLSAGYGLAATPDAAFAHQTLDQNSYSVGVTLGLPVDRVPERNSYRSATISHRAALRSFELFEDELVVSVQSTFRELERRKQSLEIQRQLITDQEKNLRIAQIRFERGELGNRDVVEAQQSLLEAKNSLINEQVNYEIARLQLLRDLGILFIDEQGMWKE
jgi:outer membrane protein TolC